MFAKSVNGPTCSGKGVINGANIAKITIVVTITRPTTDIGFLLNL